MKRKIIKIAIDVDNTITEFPHFFSLFSRAMRREGCQVHILTNRPPGTEDEVALELAEHGISYDIIKITAEKAAYIHQEKIDVFFDDTDEYFLNLPESIAVFKTREPGNFDFEKKKWVYGDKTGYSI